MDTGFVYFQGIAGQRRTPGRPPYSLVARRRDAVTQVEAGDFFRDLFAFAGLPAEAYRSSALHRRTQACLRFLRVPDLTEARARLHANPDLVPETLSIVLLGVTEFYRDRMVFEEIRNRVLPSLAGLGRPLRIWSAACSDGRELGSIALLLNEAGLDQAEFLGTDFRSRAIEAAQAGEFPADALEKVEPGWRTRFVRAQRSVRLPICVQQRLRWKTADLLAGPEPGPWDMILWRNMAIYLKPEAAGRVWASLFRELAPGGYVIAGKADYPPRDACMEKLSNCIFRKRSA